MAGNRTHPGRLSSAPQTVLKTAGLASITVRRSPPRFEPLPRQSTGVRRRPLSSIGMAVIDPNATSKLAIPLSIKSNAAAGPEPVD